MACIGRLIYYKPLIRAQYLDLDQTIQGDQYAMIRDLYLQRKAFQIAEKKVIRQMYSFVC